MKKIVSFFGLGDMGLPMANNLIQAGYVVQGYDPIKKRRDLLHKKGGLVFNNQQKAALKANFVFIMIMNGKQIISIIKGKKNILKYVAKDALVIITSTVKYSEIIKIAKICTDHNILLVDCPVSGGQIGSISGKLTLMCGCSSEVLLKAKPILKKIASKIYHVGKKPGDGQTIKAALQCLQAGYFCSIFESLILGSKVGIKGKVMLDVFSNSNGDSRLLRNVIPLILDRRFKNTGSKITTMNKDINIAQNLAKNLGIKLPILNLSKKLFRKGIESFPNEDNWSIIKLMEKENKTKINK